MMGPNQKVYAVYQGEDFLCMGTPNEICCQLQIKRDTFYKRVAAYVRWQEGGGKLPLHVVFCQDDEEEEEWEDENE